MSRRILIAMFSAAALFGVVPVASSADDSKPKGVEVAYRMVRVDGLDIFYREAGPKDAPTVLLLHGFPSLSHQFRNLIPLLADEYHVVAPDFPGYGESSSPPVDEFPYTYDRFTDVTEAFTEKLGLKTYAIYLHDIGSSVGFRLAVRHPERITGLIIQNADAYDEALNQEFFKPLGATYDVDREGVIRYAFVDADFRQRAEPSVIVGVLKKLHESRMRAGRSTGTSNPRVQILYRGIA